MLDVVDDVLSPTMNPPREAKLFEKVPIVMSTSFSRPKCAAVPLPPPRTPMAWASST